MRSGWGPVRGASALLDALLDRFCKDETRFEKPLRLVFVSFLLLTVGVLTFQNITSEYRSLREPQDATVRTVKKLMKHQRALGNEILDRAVTAVSGDPALSRAIRSNDRAEIEKVANALLAGKAASLDIAELVLFSADHKFVFGSRGAQAPAHDGTAGASFRSELNTSLFRQTNGIEFGPDNRFVVSVMRPWMSDGALIGYLKVAIDIEKSLAVASSSVNAQIVKLCVLKGTADGFENSVRFHVLGGQTAAGMNLNAVISGIDEVEGLDSVFLQDGKIHMLRDLPITVVSQDHDARLVLVKDITKNVWTFARATLFSLAAGAGLALVAWAVVFRLLSRLQASVQRTQDQLEAEVLDNTRMLRQRTQQLTEAQHIAHVGSWERDLQTNRIQGSEEYFRIMGVPGDHPPEDIQTHILARIPDGALSQALLAVEDAIRTCGKFDVEHPILQENGEQHHLHLRGYALAGPDGSATKLVGIVHDITERRQAEQRNHLLAGILESSLNEIFILNAETFRIDYANECALNNLGYSLEELRRHHIWDIDPIHDLKTVRHRAAPLLQGRQESLSFESIHRRKDGSDYPVELRVQMIRDQERTLIVAIANDISQRVQRENETREAKVRAERLAYFDPLTKLSNRAGCQRDARIRFDGADKPAFLVHVDMDGFKRVNDTLGHLAGDQCLEETGRRLREVCRGLGTAYRWGGDEFVILAENASSDPNELCERARRLMRQPMEYDGNRFWPTVSMGLALCPTDGNDFDTLLVNADLALYQSKENGKDRYTFFKQAMRKQSETEGRIELELKDAVKNDQFFLEFQPQVNLRSQAVTGIEALVRWRHPERGVVVPGEFLQVAEKSGLSPILGEIVIDKAMSAARDWLDAGLDFGRISVNISPSHLASGKLLEHFESAMRTHGIGPELVTAEVLESVFLNDARSGHLTTLRRLYDMGVHIELDDFGTGYASLSHVTDLPINGLKIDRSFTRQMLRDPKKEIVVNQLIHLARALDIGVVCEGVETEAEYDHLRMMGDFSIQGFLIARPMPFEKVTKWMSDTADDLYVRL